MLAKVWKKALLVVCIVACMYNIMHKLISRTSLEAQLKSVENQNSIIDMLEDSKNTNQMVENTSSVKNEEKIVKKQEKNEPKEEEITIVVIY